MRAARNDDRIVDLVLERPGLTRLFERLGIDYCCGGASTLEEACAASGVEVATVLEAIANAGPGASSDDDWREASLRDLCAHIVERHHEYLRDELPSLGALVDRVALVHQRTHPELLDVRRTYGAVATELELHMTKEEQVLFPACVALEDGIRGGFPFGSVESPIRAMVHEHEEVAAGLRRLHALTNGYEPPLDACNSYRAMLDRLSTLEADTHLHVHKENNILFPRAAALEARG